MNDAAILDSEYDLIINPRGDTELLAQTRNVSLLSLKYAPPQ